MLSCLWSVMALTQRNGPPRVRLQVPLDSIQLSDPFILADHKTHLYCVTGTGGLLWKNKDLQR